MEPDVREQLDRYLAARADTPFGDVDSVSGRTLQSFSVAGQRASSNLLTKAILALDDGNLERARTYVDRAVRLPYDKHEQFHPAAAESHMMLFCLVTDELEVADEDDSRWLDAAVAVLTTADEAGRCTMRDVLLAIDHDYHLGRAERAAVRSATASVPDRAEMRDLELPPAEMTDSVLSVLAACTDYRDALGAC